MIEVLLFSHNIPERRDNMGASKLTRAILPGIVSAVMLVSGLGRVPLSADRLLFFPRLMLGSVAEEEEESEDIHYEFKLFEIFRSLFS